PPGTASRRRSALRRRAATRSPSARRADEARTAETEKGRVSSTDARPFESPGKVDDEDNCSVSRLLEQTERRTRQLSHAGPRGGEEALSSLLAGTRRLAVASERARDHRQGRGRGDAQSLAQETHRAVPRGEGAQRIDPPW